VTKSIRFAVFFVLNLAIAIVGPKILETPYSFLIYTSGSLTRTHFLEEDLLTSLTAFGLGCFVYWKWQPAASRWVWIAGACWFGWGLATTLDGRHGIALYEVFGSWTRFYFRDYQSFAIWGTYTLAFLRSSAYSAGAVCASALLHRLNPSPIPIHASTGLQDPR
jgi:hypothetical protein